MVAVGRFGLELAPGGLRLAQGLVNTTLSRNQGEPDLDLLSDTGTANDWAAPSLAEWAAATGHTAPRLTLRRDDLPPLRRVREVLRRRLRANAAHVDAPDEPIAAGAFDLDLTLTLHADGRIDYAPAGSGWRQLASLAVTEVLLAQAAGTLPRLKTCAALDCGAGFYDASPNRTRVWHDTKMCGNAPNLRASRARRG
ncbi:MAG TPA: CGNR zinc finger domain-containing protein [Pseudonocardiaceae bacterium]